MNTTELNERTLGWNTESLTYTAEDIKQIAVLLNLNHRSISKTYSAFTPKCQNKEDHVEMWLSKIEEISHLLSAGVLPEKMNQALRDIWKIKLGPTRTHQINER